MIGQARTDWFEAIDAAWEGAIAPWREHAEPFTVLFSGGVDSSLLAWEVRGAPGVRLLTIGMAGSDDLIHGRAAAQLLGLGWHGAEIQLEEVIGTADRLRSELASAKRSDRSVQISLALAIGRSETEAVICGQGIDELFGGYAHFDGLPTEAARRRSDADFEKLVRSDWPMTERIGGSSGKRLSAPYLEDRFLRVVQDIPPGERLRSPPRKAFFRAWARSRGLPELLAVRPKRAFQFGSGIDRVTRGARTISPR
jgi:asparagine synthase (glutamine-hydrolysing)